MSQPRVSKEKRPTSNRKWWRRQSLAMLSIGGLIALLSLALLFNFRYREIFSDSSSVTSRGDQDMLAVSDGNPGRETIEGKQPHSIAQEAKISSSASDTVSIGMQDRGKARSLANLFFGNSIKKSTGDSLIVPPEKVLSYGRTQSLRFIEGQLIIKYRKNSIDLKSIAGEDKAETLEKSQSLESVDEIKQLNVRLIETNKTTAQAIDDLKNNPNIEYVEPNYQRFPAVTTPNDPGFSSQWHLAKIKASTAWDTESVNDQKVIVAVIDTGVHWDHQDLMGNMWDGSGGCVDPYGVAISGGCPNHGWDFKDGDNNPMGEVWLDANSNDIGPHGTWVSGSLAAVSNNATGVSGLSYRNNIKIMALRFGLDTFSELQAISFAKNNGAKIINASYGGPSFSQLEKDAVDNFGGVFVAAAGNSASNNDAAPTYPANYTSANIISVAATNSTDALASFSNYGATSVDLAAPGQSILTTWYNSTTSYAYVNGTSFASPIVAGAAALLESKNPTLTVLQVKNDLVNSGDQLPNPADAAKVLSGKRLNVYNAYQLTYKTEKPAASSSGGTYTSIQSVSLSTLTQGAAIYYTTDGTTPTSSSLAYSGPITIQTSQTLKAVAMASGYTDSEVMSESYLINLPRVATPIFNPGGGSYATSQQVTLSSETAGAAIHYTVDGSTPSGSSTIYTGPLTVTSDQTIKAIATKYGYVDSDIASASYAFKVAKPIASPAGGYYTSVQTVTLQTVTPGARIYYKSTSMAPLGGNPKRSALGVTTLDGYIEYTGPITVPANTSLDVYATAPGLMNSDVLAEQYTISTFVPTNMGQGYVRLDRLKALTPAGGVVCVDPAGSAMETDVRVIFPSGFSLNQTLANWTVTLSELPSGSVAWPGIGPAIAISEQSVTFPSADLTPGNLYCFKFSASNTLTTGNSGINQQGTIITEASGGVQMDISNYALSIVSNDQVVINAVVPPIFSTSLSGNAAGFLTPLNETSVASTQGIDIAIETNAHNGWVAWLKSANAGLVSASAGATVPTVGSIDGVPSDLAQNYGYLVDAHISVDSSEGSGSVTQTQSFGAEYAGGETSGGTLSTVFQPIASCNGTTLGDTITLFARARVTSVQPAATDYADTLTIVTAGRF